MTSVTEAPALQAHLAADLFPMMSTKELTDLVQDIRANGLLDPIVKYEGMVLDGRNRLSACEAAGVEPRFREWDGEGGSPTGFVLSANLHRRHLTTSQLAAVGAEALPLLQSEARARQASHGGTAPGRPSLRHKSAEVFGPSATNAGRARQEVAEQLGGAVSGMSIQRAASVKEADPELFAEIKAGTTTVGSALKKAGLGPNGTRGASKVSPQRRHGAVIDAANALAKTAEKWEVEMTDALGPPEARKQLTILTKASEHLARVIEAVEYRAATPHHFLGR